MQSTFVRTPGTLIAVAVLLGILPSASGGLLSDWGLFRDQLGGHTTWVDGGYGSGPAMAGSGSAGACPCGCGAPVRGGRILPRVPGVVGGGLASHGFGAPPGYHPAAAYHPALLGGGYPPMGGGWSDTPGSSYVNLGDTCSGPPWYDVMAEAVFLRRTGYRDLAVTSQGIRGFGPPNAVLSLSDLNPDYEPGFRVSARFQLSAVDNVEATYLGGLTWSDQRRATSNNNDLYSIFSDFGNMPFGGFEDTDQASLAAITAETELDSVQVNFRRGWIVPKCQQRLTGSCLVGVRYIRVEDKLRYSTVVLPHFDPINMVDREAAEADYRIVADNDLIGAQLGFRLNLAVLPGFFLCSEGKSGIYGNDARQRSRFVSTTLDPGLQEEQSDATASYVGDFRVFFLWQFHPLWKLRGGYEYLYMSNTATSGGNFNAASPFGTVPRSVGLNNNSDLNFQGYNFGLEFGW